MTADTIGMTSYLMPIYRAILAILDGFSASAATAEEMRRCSMRSLSTTAAKGHQYLLHLMGRPNIISLIKSVQNQSQSMEQPRDSLIMPTSDTFDNLFNKWQSLQQTIAFTIFNKLIMEISKSFVRCDGEMIAGVIGITDNRRKIGWRVNLQTKSSTYYKSAAELLEPFGLLDLKLKRYSFNQLSKFVPHKTIIRNSLFVPEELQNGNYDIIPRFLENLKGSRINAYVKLNLQDKDMQFSKASFRGRLSNQKYSNNRNGNKSKSFTSKNIPIHQQKQKSNYLQGSVISKGSHRPTSVHISYTLIRSNPQTPSTDISIRQILTEKKQSHQKYRIYRQENTYDFSLKQ